MTARSFHCSFELDYVIRHAREMADAGITLNGERATESSLTAYAVILKARGFEVLPTCANHDACGHCKGHPPQPDLLLA